jgi:predicted component of type VI protein secretion system
VAKLLIFRGDTPLEQRELTKQTIRIGRGPQNDLVLEDPGKGVSRNHAEIRWAGGVYTLVDLGSQNGIWVSGSRVPSIVLEPGVSAAVGPYRLMVEAPAAAPVGAGAPISGIDTATELTQLSERSAAPLVLDNLAPPAKKQEPPPPADKRPAPGVKEPARKDRVKESTAGKPQPSLDPRLLVGIGALLLMVVVGAIAYAVMRKPPLPPWDSSVAESLIKSGKCQEALDTQINPALQRDPNNQQAAALRDECARTLTQVTSIATSSIPPTPSADDKLNEAEPLVNTNIAAECQKGLDVINAILAEDANNQRAKDMAAKATACINPTKPAAPPVAIAEKPAVAVPAPQGGLDVIQGETDKAYKARMAAARKKYEEAVAVLNSQKYSQAASLFAELMNEVPSGYLDLQQKREEARAGMRAEGKAALEAAQAADAKDNYDAAIAGYRNARQLDPSLQVEALIQRVTDRKLAAGRSKCTQGLLDFSLGNNAAASAALQDAVRLLPQTDPCTAKARATLQQLQK